MPIPLAPVPDHVILSFDNGDIQLTSVIDPETKQHLVTCDLCSQVIKLGIRGSITRISQHRDGVKCKRSAFKVSKLDSKTRNLVSEAIPIMLKKQIGRNTRVDIITSLYSRISLYFYNLNSCCSEVFARQHSHIPTTVGDA